MEPIKLLKSSMEKGLGVFLMLAGLIFFMGGVYFVPEVKFLPEWLIFIKIIGFLVGIVVGAPCFVIGVIVSWRKIKLKTPKDYRPDDGLINLLKLNTKCDIFHKVTIQNYSEYANQLIEKNPTSIFTVCTFEPCEIIDILLDLWGKRERTTKSMNDIKALSLAQFLNISNMFFPHFKTFKDFCEGDACRNVKRILILSPNFKNKNEKWMFEKFLELNGSIPCHVITKNQLESTEITFITDHVVYDEKFVMDYYDDSNTLLLTYTDKERELKRILLGIKDHFSTYSGSYTTLQKFITQEWT